MKIKFAETKDFAFLKNSDHHIKPQELANLITLHRVLVAVNGPRILGWLRWNLFWDNTPFMNLLYVKQNMRQQGIGKELVSHWEKLMKKQDHQAVMTSTQADETAQHFYRKLGYQDIGSLLVPHQALEIIFRKEI